MGGGATGGARGVEAMAKASTEATCPACNSALRQPLLQGRDRLIGVEGEFTVAECPRCGLAATLPRLQGDALARHYPDAYGPFKPPRGILSRLIAALRRRRADADLRKSPLCDLTRQTTGRVLDVGCGRGDLAAAFVRRGWRADGLEPSASAVAAARRQGVDARAGTLDVAPDDFRDYDLVVFNHSLEHVPDPVAALREARNRLRRGGPLWSPYRIGAPGSVAPSARAGSTSISRATFSTSARARCAPRCLVPDSSPSSRVRRRASWACSAACSTRSSGDASSAARVCVLHSPWLRRSTP